MRKIVAFIILFGALFLGALDLQTASKSELMSIKGIGDKKADSIIEYRKSNTITKPEDLKNIKGFGDTIIANIKNDIKINDNKNIGKNNSDKNQSNKYKSKNEKISKSKEK